ncbi:MAG: response regulator [Flavobacteriaceae bacterium]|nr:response regulator [Bacteroidia bacterium]NNF76122.1 response regulator [Flavobacteriaceae bacterium]NNK72980.1 response regulator [Flavobacteriaceae bacterium]
MLKKDRHRLLKRQIRKAGLQNYAGEKISRFLDMIDEAYFSFDTDLNRVETILEESSKELFRVNQTLRNESEFAKSRLNNIVNSIHDVLFQTDNFGNFIYLNKAWYELTGLSWKRSIGKNYKNLMVGLNRQEKLRIKKFLKERKKDYRTVFKYYKPNRELKWIELNMSITYDKKGNANGTIGTMIDVTVLKETEIQLNKASQAKDEFLSTMSHEIRTPLNAVIGLTNILLLEEHLPKQIENLEALKYSGEHLLGLINNILDLNKIHSGHVHYVEAEFSMKDLINELHAHFRHTAGKRYLVFKISTDKNIPDAILGDRLMLIQVLKNLLGNAFKFTDNGKVELRIELMELDNAEVRLKFSVSDTGIGIPARKQKSIFNRFVQAEHNTSRLYGGTGLGLTISKKILNILNSDLQLKSDEGEGSTFAFELGFKLAKPKIVSKGKAKLGETTTDQIKLKVLVAEDNKLNQMVLGKLLSKWGIIYTITNDGLELLEVFENDDFDLILMDLQMPNLDGYKTTKRIRKLPNLSKANIPIIALTAFAQEEVKIKTSKFEMNGFMTKPFNPNEFHKLLSFYGNKIQNAG